MRNRRNRFACCAFSVPSSRASSAQVSEGMIMWLSLFTVVIAISIGCGLGAVIMESEARSARRYARKRLARAHR